MKKSNIFKFKPILSNSVKLYRKHNKLLVKNSTTVAILKQFYQISTVAQLASHCKIFHNNLVGLTAGYSISLEFVGIGYRVHEIQPSVIKLRLGFSHIVSASVPLGISLYNPKKTTLILIGSDLISLCSFAYFLRSLKTPDCYKAKGILIMNEKLILKEGKKQ